MKKTLLILPAVIAAFLITEVLTKAVLDFPGYGITEHIIGITTLKNRGEIYKPFSKYMNNENGYKVFRRNNAGFPGSNIIITDASKYVLVLGNSFVESYQVEPDSISTSVFQSMLNSAGSQYQAVNLGASGHDVYDLWFRANYFERIYPPAAIILVITENGLINRSDNLDFALPPQFGIINNSVKTKAQTFFRNSSSFINLISTALKYTFAKKNDIDNELVLNNPDISQGIISFDTSGIGRCLIEFNKKYGSRFIAVSIIGDSLINNSFSTFCGNHQIQFSAYPLLIPEFEINQSGHLSSKGNQKLGEYLYESFIGYNKK